MKKESVLIEFRRVLNPMTIIFSKWHVDKAIQVPIHEGLVPIPLRSVCEPKRENRRTAHVAKRLAALVALLLGLSAATSVHAVQSVSIAWNPSSDPSTVGYVVYAGTTTNYTAQLNVGTNTAVTLTGLPEGSTNYFAVSAYNAANIASVLSPPIAYIVPGLLVMTPVPGSSRPPNISFPTAPGHWYEIQASTNLTVWTNIIQTATATTNAWVSYADPKASSFSHRFYRLVMH